MTSVPMVMLNYVRLILYNNIFVYHRTKKTKKQKKHLEYIYYMPSEFYMDTQLFLTHQYLHMTLGMFSTRAQILVKYYHTSLSRICALSTLDYINI